MKLAISNIAWDDTHDHYYKIMKQYGFTGLEIAPTKFSSNPYNNLAIASEVKHSLLANYQLSVVSMQSLLFGTVGMALFTSVEARQSLLAYLKKAIIYAKTIACPVLVFGSPKSRVMVEPGKDYPTAVEFFCEIGEFAKQHNTCVCIEPNPKEYGTNFINTIQEANQLVNDVNSDGFKMIIDTGTMLLNQDKPNIIANAFSNTLHIHISMPFLKPLNQEYNKHKQWLKDLIRLVKNAEYNQYISIEMSNAEQKDIGLSISILAQLITE